MEASINQLTTTVITFTALIVVAYLAINLIIHIGLKRLIPSKSTRNDLVQIGAVIALFGIAAFTFK